MEKTLALRFTWDPNMEGLYLRTKMIFKLEQYRSDPVKRCHNHMASTNYVNQAMDPKRIKHVVHCVNHSSSLYEDKNGHLSILTPFCTPESGSQYVPMCFKFLCKNSCPSGMNRRPTELVFTLENGKNTVLGRRKLLVRVCSCPKRDKQKEEAELDHMNAKKPKTLTKKSVSSLDTHVFKVDINVAGKENYLSVLKHAYDIMAGQALRTGHIDFFKPYLDDIQHKTP